VRAGVTVTLLLSTEYRIIITLHSCLAEQYDPYWTDSAFDIGSLPSRAAPRSVRLSSFEQAADTKMAASV
jgi:hypothetical protein